MKVRNENQHVTGRVKQRPYWLVILSVIVRAFHQVGAAVYLSSYILVGIHGPPIFYLGLSVVTGLLLIVTEGLRHPQSYREVSGLGTLIKLLAVGAAYHNYLPETAAVSAAFIIAAIAAHLPKNIRHRLVF